MRLMVFVKATEDSENGVMPSTKDLEDMGAFNEELVKAGVMLDGDGLRPSKDGVRVTYPDGQPPGTGSGRSVISRRPSSGPSASRSTTARAWSCARSSRWRTSATL